MEIRWTFILTLLALFVCIGIPESYDTAPTLVRMLSYHFFHANICHLTANCMAVYFIFNSLKPGQFICAYILACLAFVASPMNSIGFSNIIYAAIGMRTPSLKSPWWKSRNTIVFLFVTLLMVFVPKISALTHMTSFALGVMLAAMNRLKRRIDEDYEKAKGRTQ